MPRSYVLFVCLGICALKDETSWHHIARKHQ